MKCPNPACGADQPDGAVFCDLCGTPLGGGAVQPTVPAAGMPYAPPAAPYPPAPVQAPVAAPAGGTVCPNCGAAAMPGVMFCESCGFSLQGAAPTPQAAPPPAVPYAPPYGQQPQPPVVPPPVQPVMPQVVPQVVPPAAPAYAPPAQLVLPTGQQFPLAGKAEYVIGRQDPQSGNFPEVDLDPHGGRENGVSRRHARIFFQNGFFLEDLQSVNFTHLNKQKLLPKQPTPLKSGDEIMLGRLVLNFYTS